MNVARQRLIGEIRRPGERQGRFKAVEKSQIVLVVTPSCNGLHVKPACHLSGGVDRVIHGNLSNEDGGYVVLTTDAPQESKNRFYILGPASKCIVELIEDQDPGRQPFEQMIDLIRFAANTLIYSHWRPQGMKNAAVEMA